MGEIYDEQAETFADKAPTLLWWEFIGKPAYDRNIGAFYNQNTTTLGLGCANASRVEQLLVDNGVLPENITGVEISPDQVADAKIRMPKATFIQGDISTVELEPDKFDLVTSNMVLEFLGPDELVQTFKNAYTALKPRGTLFFVTTHPKKMKEDGGLEKPGEFIVKFPWGGEGPNYYRTLENFKDALEEAGFEIEEFEELQMPIEAKEVDADEYQRYADFGKVRLAVKATKPL